MLTQVLPSRQYPLLSELQQLPFNFWGLIYDDLSYASPYERAERNACKKQKVSLLTCPTSLLICMILLSRKCPEPLWSLFTEKNVVTSCLNFYLERCPCMTFVYAFSWWGKQDITILFSITNDIVPWPLLIHLWGMQ